MASPNPMSHTSASPKLTNVTLQPAPLPVAQLESLRSKINSMVESIQALQWTIEVGGQNVMPAWPDILSKYTILLSQSHNLSMSLVSTASASRANGVGATQAPPPNAYERLALHPSMPMSDTQLDNDVIPLLRNQQTTDVLRLENDTVRHLAEHMSSRGSLGVLGITPAGAPSRPNAFGAARKPEYTDVLAECAQIRQEHDERVDRAVRAVTLLREKYDWKARVEVEQEEPEELDWDPRGVDGVGEGEDVEMGGEGEGQVEEDKESNSSDDEEELEEVLGHGEDNSPSPEPSQMQIDAPPPNGQAHES